MIFQQFNLVGRLDVLTNVLIGRLDHGADWRSLLRSLDRGGQGDRPLRAGAVRHRRPSRRSAPTAVGRPAAARRDRARAGAGAGDHPRRRADRLARSAQHPDRDGCAAAHQQALRHHGASATCIRSISRARYCDRLVGMAAGRVVFDGAPAALTDDGRARALRPRGRRGRWTRERAMPAAEAQLVPAVAVRRGEADRHATSTARPDDGSDPCSTVASRSLGAAALALARPARPRPGLEGASIPSWSSPSSRPRTPPASSSAGRRSSNICRKELGTKVTLRIANDYAAVIEGQRAGNIHIAHVRPGRPSPARCMTGAKIEPFAIEVNADGTKGYYSVALREEGRALPEDRGPQGQEPRPGRSRTRPPATTCRASR